MKNFFRYLAFSLILILSVSLIACSDNSGGDVDIEKENKTEISDTNDGANDATDNDATDVKDNDTSKEEIKKDIYPTTIDMDISDSVGLGFELNDDGKSYYVSYIGDCTDTVIGIPNTYEGLPVTRIGAGAFWGDDIVAVSIPENVTEIGTAAFRDCSSLEYVEINGCVEIIEENAFTSSAIKQIVIPEGLKTIEDDAFSSCKQLSVVILPASLEKIGESQFSRTTMTEIYFKGTIEQWESVSKRYWLRDNSYLTKVICSDGSSYRN